MPTLFTLTAVVDPAQLSGQEKNPLLKLGK